VTAPALVAIRGAVRAVAEGLRQSLPGYASALDDALVALESVINCKAKERVRSEVRRTARPPVARDSSLSLLFEDQREQEGERERESVVRLCAVPVRQPEPEPMVDVRDLLTDELSSIALLPECEVRDLAHHWRTFCARYAGKLAHSARAGPWANWLCKGRKWDLEHPTRTEPRARAPDWAEENRSKQEQLRLAAVPPPPEFRAVLARLAKTAQRPQTEPKQAQGA